MNTPKNHDRKNKFKRIFGNLLSLTASALVLIGGIAVAKYMISNPRSTPRKPPVKTARLVTVTQVEVGDYPIILSAMGEAVPAQQVELKAQVSGRIVSIHRALEPGGRFSESAVLVQIDPTDYELVLRQRNSELNQARSQIVNAQANLASEQKELAIEQGNQLVVQREFELLGENIPEDDRALILRQPQLQAAQAMIESAQAAVEAAKSELAAVQSRVDQARLNLERTSVRVPFNAMVMEKFVDIGAVVSTSTVLATLLGTDLAWVDIAVPAADVRWIQFPDKNGGQGSSVQIFNESVWGPDVYREGRVIRLMPQIDTQGRMARVLVAVDDPLALASESDDTPALLIGSYVRTRIIGPIAKNVIQLPRSLVWEGNTVRLMNDTSQLELRRIKPLFKGPEDILVAAGLSPGERIVTTDLSTAVNGLTLRLADQPADDDTPVVSTMRTEPIP